MADDSSKLQNLEMALKDIEVKPISLPLGLLKKITNNFSDEIGRGGFGVVYKGVLGNGEIVAVKKLKIVVDNPMQFENEAGHLMELKHQNIVRFLGYCCEAHSEFMKVDGKFHLVEDQAKLLCWEYMQNGSLEKHIQDASSGLDWNKRYGIIKGICCGLQYLHKKNLIHLDLKPANILLSNEMVPKIADFGLSRLFSKELSRFYTDNKLGTRGYMAREYIDRGLINKGSDIFSLGVIVLEMVTGHRDYPWTDSTGTSSEAFVKDVLEKWRQCLMKELRTSSLENVCQQIERCIKLGLDCTQTNWRNRPTIEEITRNLSTWEILNTHVENASSSSTPPVNKTPPNNQSSGPRSSTYGGFERNGCSACNKPIPADGKTRFFTEDGKRYHEQCYKEHSNLKCVICNNFIPSDSDGKIRWGVRPSGEKYCLSHENNGAGPPSAYGGPERDGCSVCNKPILPGIKFFTKDGKRYHELCYKEHFNLKCVICNNFIPSDSNGRMKWGVRPSGEKYCLSH